MNRPKDSECIVPVLLAGGVGSRLWPMSREYFPKQCINLDDPDKSLIQQTAERVVSAGLHENPIVVCNDEHRFLIAQQLFDSGVSADVILEPEGRNTAPAIALAAFQAIQTSSEAIMLVLPADHIIRGLSEFTQVVSQGVAQAKKGKIVAFGVQPTYAETGYGYIQACDKDCVSRVKGFEEKPDSVTAKRYVSEGGYYWNSGMYVVKAKMYLEELKSFQPAIYDAMEKAYAGCHKDLDFIRVDSDAFKLSPSDSIDYAIMEKTDKAVVVPYRGDWSDIGAWAALYDLNEKDENNNVVQGDVLTFDSKNSFIRSESRLVAAVGVENLAIVETKDAVAVVPLERAQEIKRIVAKLKEASRQEHEIHTTVYRPWGRYESIDNGARYKVKTIVVKPGHKLSVQMHHHRAEHWVVVSGTASVTIGDENTLVSENESIFIPIGAVHALENCGRIPLELIEVQTGSYLGEDDIVRFEDRYGRV